MLNDDETECETTRKRSVTRVEEILFEDRRPSDEGLRSIFTAGIRHVKLPDGLKRIRAQENLGQSGGVTQTDARNTFQTRQALRYSIGSVSSRMRLV